MQNNGYQIVASNNPFDDYSNQQLPPNSNQAPPAQQMQMNGPPRGLPPPQQQQRMQNMQPLGPNQQMHNNYQMSTNGMMQAQPNYPPQMNGMPPNGQMVMQPQMNGLPMSNYPPQQMMQNNMSMPPNGNPQQQNAFGKRYPVGQPIISNPANPNAPPIYACGNCRREVHENEQGIMCESSCTFWYHRQCTSLTEAAFKFLKTEVFAEWVCEICEKTGTVPLVKECKP